jgi:hypothetical protein
MAAVCICVAGLPAHTQLSAHRFPLAEIRMQHRCGKFRCRRTHPHVAMRLLYHGEDGQLSVTGRLRRNPFLRNPISNVESEQGRRNL